MPTDLSEAQTGNAGLVFPDDLSSTEFRLTESSLYDAEEVQDEIDNDGTPAYGRWFPASTSDDDEAWVCAPGELVSELQRLEAEAGEAFVVTRCEKSGRAESDPYEVNAERLSDDDQTRL